MFAILFNNMVEIYNVNDETGADKPCSMSVFDVQLTSFAFVGE